MAVDPKTPSALRTTRAGSAQTPQDRRGCNQLRPHGKSETPKPLHAPQILDARGFRMNQYVIHLRLTNQRNHIAPPGGRVQ
eukprot:2110401-Amphidinium_carterae.1